MAESDWKYLQYNVENGQKRTSDGPSGGPSSLADLDDTSISNPSDGQMLGYDGTEGKWKNVAAPAGSVTDVTLDGNTVVNGQGVAVLTTPNVNDLKDTNISSPSNGQTLQYNATNQKWENTTPASGGNVDDVKVNGTSVVTNKVANITSYKEVTQAQYEALPDTKLNDGVLYAIKDGGQAIEGFPPLIYSKDEREVGVWHNGKPLYEKTISREFSANEVYQIATGIDEMFLVDVLFDYASGRRFSNIYISTASVQACRSLYLETSNGTSTATWQSTAASSNITFTVRYTKTTDTPGSGTWTTQGAIAHHYSIDEHIIGTWVDGKPIYEKTYTGLNILLTRGSYTHSNIIISDIDKALGCPVAIDANNQSMNISIGLYSNKELAFYCVSGDAYLKEFTIQYTKTTD